MVDGFGCVKVVKRKESMVIRSGDCFFEFFFESVCVFLMQVNALVWQCDVFVCWSVVLECKACMVFLQWAPWLCFSCAII